MLRECLRPTVSGSHVVHSDIHVKFWADNVPSAERARPRRCPGCGAAARPVGGRLGLVGHGVRERQVRGPRYAGRAARFCVIHVRRYRCRRCAGVCTVVPRGVVRRRHFGAGAIGWALFLLGCERLSSRQVRDRVGGIGAPEAGSWVTVTRWLSAAARGELFWLRVQPLGASTQRRAERVAMTLVSYAPPELARAPLGEQAFAGAELIAQAA